LGAGIQKKFKGKKHMNADYTQYETQRRVFLEYLQVMIAREDWHGVADLAMDMRELEAMQPKDNK
jgi:hypothetical protein